MSNTNQKYNDGTVSNKTDDGTITLTICFCDENCSAYNLFRENQNDLNNIKTSNNNMDNIKRNELIKCSDLVKKKIIDCRKVRIPTSINILNKNTNKKNYESVLNNYISSSSSTKQNLKPKKKYYSANGLQESSGHYDLFNNKNKNQSSIQLNQSIQPFVTININGTEFNCSSNLLAKHSTFFSDLLVDNKYIIYLCGSCVKEEIFSDIYNWMQIYVNNYHVIINEDNVVDILNTCLLLGVNDLVLNCWEMICNENIFKGEKCLKIYKRSMDIDFDLITSTVLTRILKCFSILINTKTFLELNSNQLCKILKSDDLDCKTELEVFFASCKWIVFDLKSRWCKLAEIMDCVRFGVMTSEQLCILHVLDVNNNIKCVASHPYTSRQIENGLILNSLKSEFNYPKENNYCFIAKCKELGIEIANERSNSSKNLQICICHKN